MPVDFIDGRQNNNQFSLKLRHKDGIKDGGESCQKNNKRNVEEREMGMSGKKRREINRILKKEKALKQDVSMQAPEQ